MVLVEKVVQHMETQLIVIKRIACSTS
jgi:hypothetical protein